MPGKNGGNTIRDRMFSGRKIANCISNYKGYLFGMASKETPKKFYKAPGSSFILSLYVHLVLDTFQFVLFSQNCLPLLLRIDI